MDKTTTPGNTIMTIQEVTDKLFDPRLSEYLMKDPVSNEKLSLRLKYLEVVSNHLTQVAILAELQKVKRTLEDYSFARLRPQNR